MGIKTEYFRRHLTQTTTNGIVQKAMQVDVTIASGRAVLSFQETDLQKHWEGAQASLEIMKLDDLRDLGVMFMEAYFKARDMETASRDKEIAVIGRLMRENHDGDETEK